MTDEWGPNLMGTIIAMWDEEEIDRRDIVNSQHQRIRQLEFEVSRLQQASPATSEKALIRQVDNLKENVWWLQRRNTELHSEVVALRRALNRDANLERQWNIARSICKGIYALAVWAATHHRPTVKRFAMLDL